jgi:hypothetical protein
VGTLARTGRVMRALLGAFLAAGLSVALHALAAEVAMSCDVQDASANHARRTWQLSFDQANQLVYIAKTVATAAITPATITFRVDLGTGVPFSFVIDRASGSIRVTAGAGTLYNGVCKVTSSSSRAS